MPTHPFLDRVSQWIHFIPSFWGSKEIFWTLALLSCASLAARIQFKRILSRKADSLEDRRQARANFRNALIFATLGMLGFVWGGELQSMIISLAAIAAAILIVSKELISCFYGSLVFNLSKPARIGDAIEIGPHKGELLDHNWLSITLLEISDTHFYSGRVIKVPSSSLLATPLINLSQGGPYRFGTLLFHVRHEHARAALGLAQAAALEVCSPWTEDARGILDTMSASRLAHMPDVEAQATMISIDKDSLAISLRFIAPASRRAWAQASISKLFFEGFESHLKTEKAAEADKAHERSIALAASRQEFNHTFASTGATP
jgi:hypothetical protein